MQILSVRERAHSQRVVFNAEQRREERSHERNGQTVQADAAPRVVAYLAGLALIGLGAQPAAAQTYGFATLQPGSLNHTTASSIAKVLKEKAGMNVLVQPTAGDTVIIPMVGRGEAEIGISNIMETQDGLERFKDLRLIAAVHALRTPFFVRKDSHDARRSPTSRASGWPWGYSAMRVLDTVARAMLATANLTESDIKPVLVPNVVRGADDFVAGAVDVFFFAFGAPKVREVDATVGGIRAIETDEKGMPAARKIMPWGYLTEVSPGPVFIGVEKPMNVYSFDNVIFTNAKVPEATIYKILDTLDKNKADLVAVQPVLREFSAAFAYKKYGVPYHPGALKYFKEHNLEPQAAGLRRRARRNAHDQQGGTTMSATRYLITACAGAAALALASGAVQAQTLGFASMQPGTINHTTSSAIAKVLKEKGGLNTLVQATAGESVMIAIVGRGEADFGMANAPEIGTALANNGQPNLRMIGAGLYAARPASGCARTRNMHTIADLRGKRVTMGYSAMRALDPMSRAILATGGLTENDIKPVLVPNVMRSADDFVGRRGRHVHVRLRRAEGARGRCQRRRHALPGDPGFARHGRGPQDFALRLSERRRARTDLHRRRKADEGLHHRQPAVHQRQGVRRRGVQGDRDHGGQQGRHGRDRAEPAGVLRGRAQQDVRASRTTPAP